MNRTPYSTANLRSFVNGSTLRELVADLGGM